MWLLWLLLAALLGLMPSDATFSPLEEAMRLNYRVLFSRNPLPRGLHKEQYYPLRLSNGSRFVCVVPEVSQQQETSAVLFAVNRNVPARLLQRIHERFRNVCVRFIDGWWTYQFCWNDEVVQLHLPTMILKDGVLLATESQGSPTRFLLGVAPSKESLSFHFGIDPFGDRFISTRYPNGDLCDLTNAPRETEIRLYCAQSNEEEKMTLREVEACRYVTSLKSKYACIPELQPEMGQQPITCHEIDFATLQAV
ncbi:hypothetical protein TraAM80_03863 [Trypanosoma rangeli]|uniref:MRH domain-containing protein n=1 Tax=Trypanosoma rangeli TaxID=5698 RepID=A0A3R7KHI0_TRYRA|nr:uncharacterized protein TraAM80_03863 [Trypanosoma rangeli]RNF06593.1 hypothetical protein TraAM80_03863 [Trypanosoma rangeli]|eukprot:RNF06593.1 hypothetical protein TraAM80_03863 [Trypanosoma rangeli]